MQSKNLYNAFHDQVVRSPGAPAVNEGDTCLSYEQLKYLAESVAQLLLGQGLEESEVVGIRYGPGIHQIVCQIGVSLANGVSFPIDPSLPEARIEQLCRQARVRYAFSYNGFKGYVETPSQIDLVSEGSSSLKLHQSTTTEEPNRVDAKVTHILHTSGTTGKPKLVQITGAAIMHLASSTDITPLRSNDKTLCINNPSFDLSLFEVWVSLLAGAEIVVAPKTAAHLTVKIRQTFEKSISLQDLYDNSRFGETLQFIQSAKDGEATEKIALIERLKTDACLADDILPSSGSTPTATETEEVHVFLTGATGFLGSYFLKQLSCTVATKSRVTCLIRSRNNLSANARLREALRKYDLWDENIEKRISVVDGDLATHHFGLADEEYSRLARSVSVIYHFGAHVNFCQPYQTHFKANVLGTKNILYFASNGLSKTIHYASTIDAWGATGLVNGTTSLLEDEALEPHIQGPLHDTGYSQSQWVAESLMRRAIDRGFSVSIYRLGTVICDSERGAGNPNDFFARVVMGSAKVGFFPLIQDLRWEYVTIDYACAAIYHISRSPSNVGRSYSIVSPDPKQSISLERTGKLLQEAGYPVELVSYQEWLEAVSEDKDLNDSPLLALMPLLREPVLGELTRFETSQKTPIYRTNNTQEALADAADINYVPLSAEMFRMMFDFWVMKGYYAT